MLRMSVETTPYCTLITDPCEFLKITLNSDGTLTRKPGFPLVKPNSDDLTSPVLSKDITINPSNNTSVRIFLPSSLLETTRKLPLLIYFHGGGFIHMSAASSPFHDYCSALSLHLPAIVVSVEYRLAPEHRLPAAYDDSMEALHWIKTLNEQWLRDYADYNNCFLTGISAGGNIAYNVALRSCFRVEDLKPLNIKELIPDQPFFGGFQRTESESEINDPVSLSTVYEFMWELSLPIGADRDHEYCNPTLNGGLKGLDKIKELGWKVLVTGWHGDPLIYRQKAMAELMKGKGIEVEAVFPEGGFHGKDIFGVYEADGLSILTNFIR